jgi:hypothetical protein
MTVMIRLSLLLTLALACGDDSGPSGTDAGRRDSGRSDGGGGTDGGGSDGGGTDGGGSDGGGTDAGSVTDGGQAMCMENADCVWGEIDHEITRREDCICLFGCPSIIQNVETRDRRAMQYEMFCDPRFDGMGEPCPVDDCIPPPPLFCREGVCGM